MVFPFMLILEAASETSELLTPIVTKLQPDAVTLVVVEIAFMASAFAAAEALVDEPTAVSFILISCEEVSAFVETRSELI